MSGRDVVWAECFGVLRVLYGSFYLFGGNDWGVVERLFLYVSVYFPVVFLGLVVHWSCVLYIESVAHTAGVFNLFFVEFYSLIWRGTLFLSCDRADCLPEFGHIGFSVECCHMLFPFLHSLLGNEEVYLGVQGRNVFGVRVVSSCFVSLLDQAGGCWRNVGLGFGNASGGNVVSRSSVQNLPEDFLSAVGVRWFFFAQKEFFCFLFEGIPVGSAEVHEGALGCSDFCVPLQFDLHGKVI